MTVTSISASAPPAESGPSDASSTAGDAPSADTGFASLLAGMNGTDAPTTSGARPGNDRGNSTGPTDANAPADPMALALLAALAQRAPITAQGDKAAPTSPGPARAHTPAAADPVTPGSSLPLTFEASATTAANAATAAAPPAAAAPAPSPAMDAIAAAVAEMVSPEPTSPVPSADDAQNAPTPTAPSPATGAPKPTTTAAPPDIAPVSTPIANDANAAATAIAAAAAAAAAPPSAVRPGPAPKSDSIGENVMITAATGAGERAPAAAATTAANAPSAPAPAPPPPPAAQLAAVIRPLQRGADGQYQLKLEMRPPELGRVDMRIEMRDGVLHASIHTEHAQTAELVRSALDDLRARLDADGMQSGQFTVDQHGAGTTGRDAHGSNPERLDDVAAVAPQPSVVAPGPSGSGPPASLLDVRI
jgi:flagellar hook-length control protein FliK